MAVSCWPCRMECVVSSFCHWNKGGMTIAAPLLPSHVSKRFSLINVFPMKWSQKLPVAYEETLVGGLEHFFFSPILGISSSQLTFIFFQRGRSTTNQRQTPAKSDRLHVPWPKFGRGAPGRRHQVLHTAKGRNSSNTAAAAGTALLKTLSGGGGKSRLMILGYFRIF